jgi:hypothetical protein
MWYAIDEEGAVIRESEDIMDLIESRETIEEEHGSVRISNEH